ncbi:MAG: HAD hydrolase-like protein [Parcubacteria group bacterium]|jgi:phosphoglycolate phosphatase
MAKKKLIIFDFDGTLVDSFQLAIAAFNSISKRYGLKKVPLDELDRLRNLSSRELIAKWNVPFWKMPFVIRAARKEFGTQIDKVELFPKMETTLLELKKRGYALCLLTANSQVNVDYFLQKHNLNMFDWVYGGCGLFEKSKVMRKILQKFNCEASEALNVGDETRDIEAAKKCQIPSVAVSYGFNAKQILQKFQPDFLIDRPEDLLTINF